MIKNRYFILPNPNPHSSLWDIVVEREDTIRTNLLGNKMVVKLYVGDTANHPILNGITEYTHSEILTELNSPEWVDDSGAP